MLPADATIISVDDHVIEHPRVWLDRLPAKYSDIAPRISTWPPDQKWRDADRDSDDNLFRDDVQTIRLGLRHVTSGRCAQAAKLARLFIRRGWDGQGLRPCGPDCAVNQVR